MSKHDTSTRANDPNEAELHSHLSAALGRSEGNPLYVVSQKTLTGHAKGGAALFQAAGLIDIFRRQEIPANRSLDCLDPDMAQWMPLLGRASPWMSPRPRFARACASTPRRGTSSPGRGHNWPRAALRSHRGTSPARRSHARGRGCPAPGSFRSLGCRWHLRGGRELSLA